MNAELVKIQGKFKNLLKIVDLVQKSAPGKFYSSILLSIALSFIQISGISAFIPVLAIIMDGNYHQLEKIGLFKRILPYLPSDAHQVIVPLLVIIFILIILRSLLNNFIMYLRAEIKTIIDSHWQVKVLDHWLNVEPLSHNTEDKSHLIHVCGQDIRDVGQAGAQLISFFCAIVQMGITISFLTLVSWKLVVLAIVFALAVMLPASVLVKKIYQSIRFDVIAHRQYSKQIFDLIKRIDLIDIYSYAQHEMVEMKSKLKESVRAQMEWQKIKALGPLTVDIIGALFICLMIFFFYHSGIGQAGFNKLILFLACASLILPQINILVDSMNSIARIEASLENINKVLSLPIKKVAVPKQQSAHPKDFNIDIQDATFSYQRPNDGSLLILNKVNLRIPQKKLTMVFGASGAGKTTFLKILQRVLDLDEGKILIGGVNSHDFDEEAWRNMVLLMPQEDVIFEGTLKENIAYGNPNLNEKDLIESARLSCSLDFVGRSENGFNHRVGSDGGGISGGQKQRISLARIIAKQPKVLLMDEPTSHLDRYTEKEVLDNLQFLVKNGSTVIISTHKVELAPLADHLLWFEREQIFEGSFEQFKENLAQLNYIKHKSL